LDQLQEQPVRGQKPWFGPPILQADGIVSSFMSVLISVIFIHFKVEESPEIQPSAVALPSPLIATLIQTEEEPTEKPVRGHKPWFGPPFLPADPVKQPKPIIVICFKYKRLSSTSSKRC
jgi:hypothetical protein